MIDEARMFKMVRNRDETGVSGTGVVADGIEFPNGMVSVCWRSKTPSVNVYRSFVEFKHVHIDAHPSNDTEIHWAEASWPEPAEETEGPEETEEDEPAAP